MSKNHHITKPGDMTIVEIMGQLEIFTDVVKITSELEPGKVYDLSNTGTALRRGEPLTLPIKIYDFDKSFRQQVLRALRSTNDNMNIGVVLEGYKGQGKSVVAKQLAIESGLPIIRINSKIQKTADFVRYLSSIKQDYTLLIDEFEKLFNAYDDSENNYHSQDSFLSFMDGSVSTNHKRLIILTTNTEINDKLINRPSRVRYYKRYNSMPEGMFNEIIKDHLKNKEFEEDLRENISDSSCTIDILMTIIDEVNLQNIPYSQFKNVFNHREPLVKYEKFVSKGEGKWAFVGDLYCEREFSFDDGSLGRFVGNYGAKGIGGKNGEIYYMINEDGEKTIYKLVKPIAKYNTLTF